MSVFSHAIRFAALTALVFQAAGCGQSKPAAHTQAPQSDLAAATRPQEGTAAEQLAAAPDRDQDNHTCRDENAIRESERNRAQCFHLRPGVTTTKIVPVKTTHASAKKGKSKKVKTKVVRVTGPCQPQSLIYARCRTGVATCRMGDTSPVQWFACAKSSGATSATPLAGAVMVLGGNSGRGMPTGHPAYVEAVQPGANGLWTLRISHTNYDRQCHLDQDAKVVFDPKRMTASFETGPWHSWAKDLKVLGFIVR